jgi:hypothetical protein
MSRRTWNATLFRAKHPNFLAVGELLWTARSMARTTEIHGPYRLKRIEPQCPGQLHVEIVGMEDSGLFQLPWANVMVPRYR